MTQSFSFQIFQYKPLLVFISLFWMPVSYSLLNSYLIQSLMFLWESLKYFCPLKYFWIFLVLYFWIICLKFHLSSSYYSHSTIVYSVIFGQVILHRFFLMSLIFFFNKNLPYGNTNRCLDFLISHGHLVEVFEMYMAFRHSRCNVYLLKKIYNPR